MSCIGPAGHIHPQYSILQCRYAFSRSPLGFGDGTTANGIRFPYIPAKSRYLYRYIKCTGGQLGCSGISTEYPFTMRQTTASLIIPAGISVTGKCAVYRRYKPGDGLLGFW